MKKIVLAISLVLSFLFLGSIIKENNKFLVIENISSENFYQKVQNENASLVNDVLFENHLLAYDKSTNNFFITIGENVKGKFDFDGKIYWIDENKENFSNKIMENLSFKVGLIRDNDYYVFDLKITTLPIIEITADEVPVSKTEENPVKIGTMTVIDPDNKQNNIYSIDTYNMNFNARGQTALYYPKKSYEIELVSENGERNPTELLGMRYDDDYNLNAVYGDNSKIREKVALELMQDMADTVDIPHSHPQAAEFCEVFINDEYVGIYELIEQMDSKQVEIDEERDYLYKSYEWVPSRNEELQALGNTDLENNLTIRVKSYPEDKVETKYQPIIEYKEYIPYDYNTSTQGLKLDDVKKVADVQNLIDTSIANIVLDLNDNDAKNMFFVSEQQTDGSFITRKEYFDFNFCLGDTYFDDDKVTLTGPADVEYIYPNYTVASILYSDSQEFEDMYAQRYNELRQTVFSQENIIKTIEENYNVLNQSGAYQRDEQRWEMDIDHKYEYERMKKFVEDRLEVSDRFIENIENFDVIAYK